MAVLAVLAGGRRDATDLDAVRADLNSTVHRALEPAHLSLWLGRAEQLSPTRVGLGGFVAAGAQNQFP